MLKQLIRDLVRLILQLMIAVSNMMFREIINSSKYQEILNGFNRRELVSPLCQRCGYRERFK